MDVDDAPGEALEEHVLEDRHVAGEDHKLNLALAQPVGDRRVPRRPARELTALEDRRGHAGRPRAPARARGRLVGGARHDLGLAAVHPVEQRLEVRSLARGQDADPHAARASRTTRSFGYAPPVDRSRPAASSASTCSMTSPAARWPNAPYSGSPS